MNIYILPTTASQLGAVQRNVFFYDALAYWSQYRPPPKFPDAVVLRARRPAFNAPLVTTFDTSLHRAEEIRWPLVLITWGPVLIWAIAISTIFLS